MGVAGTTLGGGNRACRGPEAAVWRRWEGLAGLRAWEAEQLRENGDLLSRAMAPAQQGLGRGSASCRGGRQAVDAGEG